MCKLTTFISISIIFFYSQIARTQSDLLVSTINEIEFSEDTIHSVYHWVCNNIRYDVKKANENAKKKGRNKTFKVKSIEDQERFLLQKVIQDKKGVCQDYSILFRDIVNYLGYESHIIKGYTKNSKGKINKKMGHTWNVVKVNGEWKLYDPTWGSGTVKEGKTFVKNYNEKWFDVNPEEMIKTHMPFDPMWQLFDQPITYHIFEFGSASSPNNIIYEYEELIATHMERGKKQQLEDQLSRSLQIGSGISLVSRWRSTISKNIGQQGKKSQYNLLNETGNNLKKCVDLFNEYVDAKNDRFSDNKWSLDYTRQYLEEINSELSIILETFEDIDVKERKARRSRQDAIRTGKKMMKHIDKELNYLDSIQK